MAIYCGYDGVVRTVPGIDVGVGYNVRHAPAGFAGIDGVTRQFSSLAENIQRVEFRIVQLKGRSISTSDSEYISKSEISQYGGYSIYDSGITVYSTIYGKELTVYLDDYVIFKDGHEQECGLGDFPSLGCSFSANVAGRLSSSNYNSEKTFSGTYNLSVYGTPLRTSSFTGSVTVNKTITEADYSSDYYAFAAAAGVAKGSGRMNSVITLDYITADGIQIPCKFVDIQ